MLALACYLDPNYMGGRDSARTRAVNGTGAVVPHLGRAPTVARRLSCTSRARLITAPKLAGIVGADDAGGLAACMGGWRFACFIVLPVRWALGSTCLSTWYLTLAPQRHQWIRYLFLIFRYFGPPTGVHVFHYATRTTTHAPLHGASISAVAVDRGLVWCLEAGR